VRAQLEPARAQAGHPINDQRKAVGEVIDDKGHAELPAMEHLLRANLANLSGACDAYPQQRFTGG
jgi:hypothetical protein